MSTRNGGLQVDFQTSKPIQKLILLITRIINHFPLLKLRQMVWTRVLKHGVKTFVCDQIQILPLAIVKCLRELMHTKVKAKILKKSWELWLVATDVGCLSQWGSIRCNNNFRWQHLSRVKNVAFVLTNKSFLFLINAVGYHLGLLAPSTSHGAPLALLAKDDPRHCCHKYT